MNESDGRERSPSSRLDAFAEVCLRVGGSLELADVLRAAADGARALTGARHAAVALFDESGDVGAFAAAGETPALFGAFAFQDEDEDGGEPPNPTAPPDIADVLRSAGFPEHGARTAKAFLAVPVRGGGGGADGCLYIAEKSDGDGGFAPADGEILTALASQTAVAVANALRHADERRARRESESERRRVEALIETSPVGVLVVDAKTRTVVSVNREAERIMGVPPPPGSKLEEYQRVSIYRSMDGREYAAEERPLSRALDAGETTRAEEILFDKPEGGTVTTLVNATPIRSADGEIASAVAVIQDMTPLEELERMRSEFIGIVGHELRTPLTSIKGAAASALGSPYALDSGEARQFFQIIDERADHLRDLINNLLDATRIEAGTLAVHPKPADAAALAREARNDFLRRFPARRVETDVPENLPPIQADARRVAQVFSNLLSNAAKYSPEDSPIAISAESKDGFYVSFAVSDEGRGLTESQLPRVFEKFWRVDESADARKVAGDGLGLAICKGIVEAHGGRIWAESADGRGSRFAFTIPASAVEASAAPAATARPPAERPDGAKILAVDDEIQILRYLRSVLSKAGYAPLIADSPDEALRLTAVERPSLALLDLAMPRVSGFELMERVRKVSDVPVIFLTAHNGDENLSRALDLGADDYIVKPFSPTELTARIEATLRKRAALAAAASESRGTYRLGDLAIDRAKGEASLRGEPIELTPTERAMLMTLCASAGRVVEHKRMAEQVWGADYTGDSHIIRAFARRLRLKLGDDARSPTYIFTERGVGFRMAKGDDGEREKREQ